MRRDQLITLVRNGLAQMGYPEGSHFDGRKIDANETAVFAQQLEHVFAKIYDFTYLDLKARQILPVNTEVPSGAETHAWYELDSYGKAKKIANYANDFPSVEIKGAKNVAGVLAFGASYQYTIQDLRAASMTGIDLSSRKAETARRVMEEFLDNVACNGDSDTGVTGLLSGTNTVAATTGDWQNAATTASQILTDVQNASKKMFDDSKGKFTPDTLLVGTKSWSKLTYMNGTVTVAANTYSTDRNLFNTVLQYVPGLTSIVHWPRLDTAGSASKEMAVLLKRDPSVLEMVIPQDFEQFPPQQRNLAFIVSCHQKYGGVNLYQPKGVLELTGVEA